MDAESQQVEYLTAANVRLKQSNDILSDLLYKMEAKANRRADLITELCAALKKSHVLFSGELHDLIQRAEDA